MDVVLESLRPNQQILRKLAQAGIKAKEVEILAPKALKGIAFLESDMVRALEVLKLGKVEFVQADTNVAGTRLMLRKNPIVVSARSWDGSQREKFIAVAEENLLLAVDKEVVIDVPHKNVFEPREDGKFHVLIWSAPAKTGFTKPPSEMWGNDVDCRDEAFRPSGLGDLIVDSSGHAVAEIVGNNLYVFHDLCHQGTADELLIFRQICAAAEQIISIGGMTPEEKEAWLADKLSRSRQRYVQICENRWGADARITEREMIELAKANEKDREAITRRTKKINDCKAQLEKPPVNKEADRLRFADEFDNLCNMPLVESVEVDPDVIRVFTGTLQVGHHGNVYELGKYRIEIGVGPHNLGSVRCYNLTHMVEDREHPNGFGDGSICFGNIGNNLAEMIANYQIAVAVNVIIQFLQYADEAGWMRNLKNWPKVGRESSAKSSVTADGE